MGQGRGGARGRMGREGRGERGQGGDYSHIVSGVCDSTYPLSDRVVVLGLEQEFVFRLAGGLPRRVAGGLHRICLGVRDSMGA